MSAQLLSEGVAAPLPPSIAAPRRPWSRQNLWNLLLCLAALAVVAYSLRGMLVRLGNHTQSDFFHFYEAAGALRAGADLYESGKGGYIYPPLFACLLQPLAALPYGTASVIWAVINLLLIVAILFLGFRVLQKGFRLQCTRWQAAGMCSLAMLLTSEQIRWELILGQSDTLTLAGLALCLYWLLQRPAAAGFALGAVANIKYQTVAVLPYLLFRGRWLAAAGLIVGFACCALLPALAIGWERNLEYLGVAFGGMAELVGIHSGRAAAVPALQWDNSITITSGLARLFTSAGWPERYAFPLAALVAAAVAFALWAMFRKYNISFFWRGPKSIAGEASETGVVCLEWCALLMGLLIFSPQGSKRHLFLLLTVHLLVAMILWLPRPRVGLSPLILGVLIAQLGLRLPSKSYSEAAAAAWHHLGGPGWCVLAFLLCTIWTGLAYWQDVHGEEAVSGGEGVSKW